MMKSRLFNLFGVLVIMSMLVSATATMKASAQADSTIPIKDQLIVEKAATEVNLKDAIRTADGLVRVIVQLSDPALALYKGGISNLAPTSPEAIGKIKLDVNSPASVAYIAYLEAIQNDFISQLISVAPEAQVYFQYQVAFNGVSIAIAPDKVDELSAMNGVAKVYPDIVREVEMDASLPLINAPAMWAVLGGESHAGEGIKVADVDTGLRPDNPMFSGTGFTLPVGYPKGYCATNPLDPDFQCNNKLIAARVFPDPTLPVAPEETETPLDIDGHGSHTAGTAAGNQVTVAAGDTVPVDTVISGVAPAAYLMVYKALFEKPDYSTAYGSDSSLIAALNAALTDGADVINNSWGGGAGADPNSNVEKPVIDAITAAGTLVVFSAGNSGPGNTTVGCPGCVENALTVAASTTDRIFANEVNITGPAPVPSDLTSLAGLQGTGPKLAADIVDTPLKYDAANNLGCDAFDPGTFTDAVALIQRGTCNFSVKVDNATAAGAVAVIIFNNAGGPPSAMGALELTTIPSMMITLDDGLAVKAWVVANPDNATVSVDAAVSAMHNPAWEDIVASFSSRGPNGDPSFLKPDITAPGVNILSAYSPALIPLATDPVYALLQGTSMAAPHITGSAALVMQQHPTWTPLQVKTALTSTAVQTLKKSDAINPADPFDMGAGRVDLARVSEAGLTFSTPSFANGNCVESCSWTSTIENVGSTSETWTVDIQTTSTMAVTVSPSSFTLAPGLSGEFTVSVNAQMMPLGTYQFGSLTWKDGSATYPDAYMPMAVKAGSATNAVVLTNTVDKPSVNGGDTLTYSLTVGNQYASDGNFTVTNPIPSNAEYVDGSATGGLAYDAGTNTLSGSVNLAGFEASITPTGAATMFVNHTPDPDFDLILSDYCASPCDDSAFNITGLDFWYMGAHYTSMGVSSNGFLQPGGATSATAANQYLPNPASPNNVIAPLWTDLVMKGADPSDPATGIWLIWGTPEYTVFEWQDAQQYANPSQTYTFQFWIKDGTSELTFAYGDLTGDLASFKYTVGMENSNGTAGSSYYYVQNGPAEGTPPAVGTDLSVVNNFSTALMTFQVKARWFDRSTTQIYDTANLKNDLNVDEANAISKSQLILFKSFMSILSSNP
jgi:minor extracellular serine protease Vpr